jgi:hypothetical protein
MIGSVCNSGFSGNSVLGGGAGWNMSGGGGHGGAGGTDYDNACTSAAGGVANDDHVHPVNMGSGGGNPTGCCGIEPYNPPESWGGGLIWIIVYNPNSNTVEPAVINGTINMNGFAGCNGCGMNSEDGAGGAGGAILLEASTITGSGLLEANGGQGNWRDLGGGGGGGGIISMIENLTSFTGTTSVVGGISAAGSNGLVGATCHTNESGANGSVTFTAAPASGY